MILLSKILFPLIFLIVLADTAPEVPVVGKAEISVPRKKRSIIQTEHIYNNPIPYYILPFTKNFTSIQHAIERIQNNTCIRFKEKFFYIKGPNGFNIMRTNYKCEASSGPKIGDEEHINYVYISPNCENDITQIELFIAKIIGLIDEVRRPDRDKYVHINYISLDKDYKKDFEKYKGNKTTYDSLGYDFLSATHYTDKSYGINGRVVITPKKGYEHYKYSMGQPYKLSFSDYKLLNQIYCKSNSKKNPCKNYGYPDPNKKKKCICPSGFTGDTCNDKLRIGNCGSTYKPAYYCKKFLKVKGKKSCSYFIKGKKNRKLRLTVKSLVTKKNHRCYEGMGVEIKYRSDKGVGGVCLCGNYSNLTFVSETRFAVVIYHGLEENHKLVLKYEAIPSKKH